MMSRRETASGLLLQAAAATGDAAPAKKQPIILKEQAKPSKRVAEVAGGTTAECVAVVCCCPCGLVNLVVLAVVKLPAGLYRLAVRKRNKRRAMGKMKKGAAVSAESKASGNNIGPASPGFSEAVAVQWPAKSPAAEVLEMEKEMWSQLFGTGFWRSPSQRE